LVVLHNSDLNAQLLNSMYQILTHLNTENEPSTQNHNTKFHT